MGALVHPQVGHDASAHLAVAAQSPGRYYAAHAIILAGLVLFLPALLALVHPLRGRATALSQVGCALAIIGLFGATAVVAVDGIAVSQMAQPEANAEEMAALLERIKTSAGLRAIAIIGALSFLSGMLLLAFGLWRDHAASRWMAAGLAAAAITSSSAKSLITALSLPPRSRSTCSFWVHSDGRLSGRRTTGWPGLNQRNSREECAR